MSSTPQLSYIIVFLMWSRTTLLLKTSAVVVSESPKSLSYEKRYRMLKKMTLSQAFNNVTEDNRYISLKLLLERLSGHVGRRQYHMSSSSRLPSTVFELLKQNHLDWHDLKSLSHAELLDVVGEGLLHLNHQERTVLLTATTAKVCGVLRRGVDIRHSENICMNPGLLQHGWRCGKAGHSHDVYFEGKSKRNPLALHVDRRPAAVVRRDVQFGTAVEVRKAPDFSIAGRMRHETNPRVWSTPTNAVFDVSVIGFEFRVHPDDPRVGPQIEQAADEWRRHGEVVRHVLWEMLEMYGVERDPQPLHLEANEMGQPDQVNSYTSAFSRRKRRPVAGSSASHENSQIREEDVVIEQRMESTSASGGGGQPWFLPPLPQRFTNGIPDILPYPPTFIVRAAFKAIDHSAHNDDDAFAAKLLQPVMSVTCYAHPNACYWLADDDLNKAMEHIASYAARVPYAIPFNLYLRVDPTRVLRGDDGKVFRDQLAHLAASKSENFEIETFASTQRKHAAAMRSGSEVDVDEPSDSSGDAASVPLEHNVEFGDDGEVSSQSTTSSGAPQSSGIADDEHSRKAARLNPIGWE